MKWDAVGWEMVSVEIGGGFEGDVECERTTLMAQVASREPFRPLFERCAVGCAQWVAQRLDTLAHICYNTLKHRKGG